MDFYTALIMAMDFDNITEDMNINLPRTNNPNDTSKVSSAIDKKNLELKKKKKIIKNYDPKTGRATISARTSVDDTLDKTLSKIQ